MKKLRLLNRANNSIRMLNIRLLRLVEILTEWKTGKGCLAKFSPCFNIGIGYHRFTTERGTFEFYLLPFTRVSVYTPELGFNSPQDFSNYNETIFVHPTAGSSDAILTKELELR
jgi:hypothetical protein